MAYSTADAARGMLHSLSASHHHTTSGVDEIFSHPFDDENKSTSHVCSPEAVSSAEKHSADTTDHHRHEDTFS
jgi:hypothetical protein